MTMTAESLEEWKHVTSQIETLLDPKVCGVACVACVCGFWLFDSPSRLS